MILQSTYYHKQDLDIDNIGCNNVVLFTYGLSRRHLTLLEYNCCVF